MGFELRFYGLTNAKFGSIISDFYLDLDLVGFFFTDPKLLECEIKLVPIDSS